MTLLRLRLYVVAAYVALLLGVAVLLLVGRLPAFAEVEPARTADEVERAVALRAFATAAAAGALVALGVGGFGGRSLARVRADRDRERYFAYHDPLTSLPNRQLFQDRLELGIDRARRTDQILAVVLLDVDDFKSINDTKGHDRGDAWLVEVARRLGTALRPGDTLARQGGDEFLVLLDSPLDRGEIEATAARLLALIREPVGGGGDEIRLTASVGIAVYPQDGETAAALVANADLAMYAAKDAGRGGIAWFAEDLARRATDGLLLRAEIERALAKGELVLHYQPQVDVFTGDIVGAEALVRWQHPEHGLLPPGRFLPVAEQTGLIVPIGEWVLREACAQIARWRAQGLPPFRVAVNFSARQIGDPATSVHLVRSVLQETGLPGSALEVEITETAAMRDVGTTATLLAQIRALGVAVAVDDFGTGLSSLAYLRQLPLDRVKIDRSFVVHFHDDAKRRAIVGGVVAMAHAIGLDVVAEGVEVQAELETLAATGCDVAQGYGLSRPVDAASFARLLAAGADLREGLVVAAAAAK